MENRKNWILILLLAVAVFAAYEPAWHAGFIWDDDVYVVNNTLLTAPHGLQRIWFSLDSPSQYFPMVYTVLRLERSLWGLDPSGYHLVNIFLHLVDALLVWLLLQRLKIPGAWLAAAVFALHPVEVETVAWVTELKNILSLLFSLLALLSWTRFVEEERPPSYRFYGLSLIFYWLALFSKTTACTLPAALILILWLEKKPLRAARWLQVLPFVALGAGMGVLTMWWERHHQFTFGPEFAISPLERLLIASRAVWFYAGKLIWPTHLSFSYERWQIDSANPQAYLWLAAGAMLAVVIWLSRRFYGRSIAVAALYYVATLGPLLGFIMEYTFKYSFVADHYQYAASIAPFALATVGINRALERLAPQKPLCKNFVWAILLLTLAALTWRQSAIYLNSETLWRATLARNPQSIIAQNNLSVALLDRGAIDEALSYSRHVLAAHPDNPTAELNLGYAMLKKGQVDQAIAHCRRAVALQPDEPQAYYDLGMAYLKKNQPDLAARYFTEAIKWKPEFPEAYCNLGYSLLQQSRLPEAMIAYHKALEQDPGYALAHNDLGNILLHSGRADEAMEHFQQAVAARPDFAEAHFNLAEIYLTRGRLKEAIQQYEDALAGRPDLVRAANNVAWLLATSAEASLRNGPQAVQYAEQAEKLTQGKNPGVLATLAAAYAEAGRFGEAAATVDRALSLAAGHTGLRAALEKQKALYQANLPLREVQTAP